MQGLVILLNPNLVDYQTGLGTDNFFGFKVHNITILFLKIFFSLGALVLYPSKFLRLML